MTPMHAMRMAHLDSSAATAKLAPGTLKRIWSFARPYKTALIAFLGTLLLVSIIGIAPPLVFRRLIDQDIPDGNTGAVATWALVILFIGLIQGLADLAGRWWSAQIGEGLIYDLRTALFDHIQRMPIGFFSRSRTGALTNRMNNDVIGAQRALTGTLSTVVSNVITLTATLITVITLEWRLTLVALALLPLFLWPAKRVGKRLATLTRNGMDLNAEMNTVTTERFSVAGALLVKLFGRYDDERAQFSHAASAVRDLGVRQAATLRAFIVTLDVLGMAALASVYWIGGNLVISNTISIGTLTALTMLVPRIYDPLVGLTNARVDVMSSFVSFERVFEVLDAPNPIVDAENAVRLDAPVGEIHFDHVSFKYPDSSEYSIASLDAGVEEAASPDWVLHDIDVRIAPGSTVALVGPSGSGKSTMATLIPRLWDVTEGAMRIDGLDVRTLTQESLHAAIGVVSQDPHLFHTTIGDNLRYGNPEATDAQVEEACRAAHIWPTIAALPDGLDTLVGERGYRMSGGEKQRLAIARMLLKDPAIVVLDEATSALDTESELIVQAALDNALQGRTSVVIAHRLSTIVDADVILVIDQGQIVESGTHRDLRALGGLYSELYENLVSANAELQVAAS